MTNITTVERTLQTIAECFLEKENYAKTFAVEGIGSMWKRGNTVIDITVHKGHCSAIFMIDPYIIVRVNDEPYIIHTEKEVKELLANL